MQHRTQKRFALLATTACAFTLMVTTACTDRRAEAEIQTGPTRAPSNFLAAAEVRYNQEDTQVFQMQYKAGSLYLTGKPFAFMRWDVDSDPENPALIAAAARDINNFSPAPIFGRWLVDWYGSGALAINGPYAYLSGEHGASVINQQDPSSPQESYRYPLAPQGSTEILRDPNFVFKAMIVHPSQPYVYGFQENSSVITYQIQGNRLNRVAQSFYNTFGSTTCCVQGATLFNNKIYVAFRSKLWVFDLPSGPQLAAPRVIDRLNAVNVAASDSLLYVQHEPTQAISAGTGLAAGIYVFDSNGANLQYIALRPLVFAVSGDDRHIFANIDDRAVKIFRMNW